MDKKGIINIQGIGIGSVLGVGGIVIMSFGASLGNDFFLRFGIVLTTIGGWLISWNKI